MSDTQARTDDFSWTRDWHVELRVWVERRGQAVLGEGKLELLEWIDRAHSISEAARQMDISYRRAWVMVQAVNEAAGEPFVTSATGGRHGGGARLTPAGRRAIALFRQLQDQVKRSAAGLLPRLVAGPATAAVHVAAAVSLQEVLDQLVTDFALRQPGTPVRVILGASDELARQIISGATVDLFLTADASQLAQLLAAELIETDTLPLAENLLAVIAPADRELQVRKPADLLAPDVKRVAVANATCPLGSYSRAYLQSLGLYDRLLDRAVLVEHSRAVVAAVQGGQADAGLVYMSAARTASGCRILFRVRHMPVPIRYVGAVVKSSERRQQARDLLEFLGSDLAARRFRRGGFLPLADE